MKTQFVGGTGKEREEGGTDFVEERVVIFPTRSFRGYGEMFRCTTRPLIDNRRSAHGRFARAYKRAAHASMETIAVYLDRPHTRTWVRRRDERARESERRREVARELDEKCILRASERKRKKNRERERREREKGMNGEKVREGGRTR